MDHHLSGVAYSFSVFAFNATMTVLMDMSIALAAGLRMMPAPDRIIAAKGIVHLD